MGASRGTGGFRTVADRYDGYTVVDADGGKIGTVPPTSTRAPRASTSP
jgi:hypothetical protein